MAAHTPKTTPTMTQRDAVRLALDGRLDQRLRVAARTLLNLLHDPEDTEQVFILGLLTGRRAFPRLLLRFASLEDGAALLAERPSLDRAHVDYDALRALPEDTLGGAYARFLDARGLSPDLFQPPPGLPEVPAFIVQRLRQTHDLWHVLTGYDTDVHGELQVLAFTFAVSGVPSTGLIAAAGALRYGVADPSLPSRVARAYRRGRRARFLPSIYWERHWDRPLTDARALAGL